MALFRALSTRRSNRDGYDRLLADTTFGVNDHGDGSGADAGHAVLKRVTSVPAGMLFGFYSKKHDFDAGFPGKYSKPIQQQQQQPPKGRKGGKSHPVFSLFDRKWRKKKMTANPDFSRYMEYLKEGGVWNKDTNSPAIYYN